jgi:hypothetical protein
MIRLEDQAEAREVGDGLYIYFIPTQARGRADGLANRSVQIALRVYNPQDTTVKLDFTYAQRIPGFFSTPTNSVNHELNVTIAPGGFYMLEFRLPATHNTIRIARSAVSNAGRFILKGHVSDQNFAALPSATSRS